ncbi:MAG: stage II sporulation protein D [Bacilli bacterium]|nr:stage II sporulation protein D [Bacilli bacterium]
MKKILVVLMSIVLVPFSITNFFYDYKINKVVSGIITNKEKETIIRILRSNNTVENLPIEEYLIGVVSSEVPVSFEKEAIKAQAVAARTYALKQMENRKNESYDVTDTTSSQVYKSEEELKNTWKDQYEENIKIIKEAINETKGQYLTYDDKIIYAFFFSTSNGKTEDNKDVFGQDLPYLKVVDSSFDESETSNFITTKTISLSEFYQKLGLEYNDNLSITDKQLTSSNRVKSININGKIFKGTDVRSKLSLRSTDFTIEKKDNNVIITTKGFGHGVGMSQYGANALAKQNKNYEEILKYYYQGTNLQKL